MSIDKVFQKLVERVTNVQIAVGVGRTVVQDESWCGAGCGICGEFGVEFGRGPVLLDFRLAFFRVGALGEGGLGEEDCVGVNVFGGLFVAFCAAPFGVQRGKRSGGDRSR